MKSIKALTLVEIMVVIALVAILASFSVSGMTSMVTKRRVKAVAQKLASEINRARFLARKSGKRVWLVTSTGESQNWLSSESLLYFIFIDENMDNSYDTNTDTMVAKGNNESIRFENNTLGRDCQYLPNAKCLVFFPVGMPLIGNQGLRLDVKHMVNDICYRIKVYRNIGLAETEPCE